MERLILLGEETIETITDLSEVEEITKIDQEEFNSIDSREISETIDEFRKILLNSSDKEGYTFFGEWDGLSAIYIAPNTEASGIIGKAIYLMLHEDFDLDIQEKQPLKFLDWNQKQSSYFK